MDIETIIFYGRRPVGLAVLSYLVTNGYTMKVISDDESILAFARKNDLAVVTLESMGEFDLFVCCHGNKILDKKYLVPGRFINIHPCLYKYKGRNPIKRFLENKDERGSVESQFMVEEVDAGAVIHGEFFPAPVTTFEAYYEIALPYYLRVIEQTLAILKDAYALGENKKIRGWMTGQELMFLHEQAQKMGSIVEVGTYRGRSTFALASGCKGPVITIDNHLMTDGHEARLNLKRFPNVSFLQCESIEATSFVSPVDMVFLDAGHEYEEVASDIAAWLPMTKRIICGHDYDIAGVKQAVDEKWGAPDGIIGSVWFKNV